MRASEESVFCLCNKQLLIGCDTKENPFMVNMSKNEFAIKYSEMLLKMFYTISKTIIS